MASSGTRCWKTFTAGVGENMASFAERGKLVILTRLRRSHPAIPLPDLTRHGISADRLFQQPRSVLTLLQDSIPFSISPFLVSWKRGSESRSALVGQGIPQ